MASAIKSALPSHLKPGSNDDQDSNFERHHGKTRSHMVCLFLILFCSFMALYKSQWYLSLPTHGESRESVLRALFVELMASRSNQAPIHGLDLEVLSTRF
jgi:hypothetical protein